MGQTGHEGSVGDGVRSHTEAYVAAIVDCVNHLPRAVEAGQDGAVGDAVAAVCEAESACDRRRRELVRTLASMPSDTTGVAAPELVSLIERLDRVPNRTERAVVTLESTAPPVGDVAELEEMVALTCEASEALAAATVAFTDGLYDDPADREAVAAATARVADAESRCDHLRRAAVREAFGGPTAEALLLRELVLAVESVTDAAEDAADTLQYLLSSAGR
jgi:uncharacterized protein Yka (UPF0111/DUF47 family)